MSDFVRPYRRQPTRLPCLSVSPGKNTGVGCHLLLQSMKVKSESEVAQSCPTVSNPMDCSPPGSSTHGIFQARVLRSGVPLPSPGKALYHCFKLQDIKEKRRRQWHPTPVLLPENSMDGGAWWAAIHGVANSWTRLSDFTFTFHFHALDKEMATHSSVLAWRIPGKAEPGGLSSMGSHRVGHD